MKRLTWLLAAITFVVILLTTPLELFSAPIAPFVALILGGVAGWQEARADPRGAGPRGALAGAIVGAAGLLGALISMTVLGLLIGSIPAVQELFEGAEPDAAAPNWIVALLTIGGVIGGVALGLVNLVLATVAGLVAALITQNGGQTARPAPR